MKPQSAPPVHRRQNQAIAPTFDEILRARKRIERYVRQTPLERSKALSGRTGCDLFLKLENWQVTGSFKVRGALNRLLTLSAAERARGVITASAGNHALGLAYAAEVCQVGGRVVLPVSASPAKRAALGYYGLSLTAAGKDYDEAETVAREMAESEELNFVHAFDDPAIIAGQGTIALEINEQCAEAETLIIPVGGGGLIAGMARAVKHLNPNIKVVGVQSVAAPAMVTALQAGKVVETPLRDSIADGLAGRFVGELTLQLVQRYVDDVVLVEEQGIRNAMRLIFETMHYVVEGSAAVGLAAIIEGKIRKSGQMILVLTGRNIARQVFAEVLAA